MIFYNRYSKFLIVPLAVLMALPAQVSYAQQEGNGAAQAPLDAEGRPQAYVSLIAIGPQAKRRYRAMTSEEKKSLSGTGSGGGTELSAAELRAMQGLPVLMPPKEGELPPSALMFADGKTTTADGKSVDKVVQLPVGFNSGSSFTLVPAGKPLDLKAPVKKEDVEGYDNWMTLEPMQPGASKLVLMYPGSNSDTRWHVKPKFRVLNADPQSFPENRVVAINFTGRQVKVMVGQDTQILKPGGSYNYTVENARKLIPCKAVAQGYDEGYVINTGFRGDHLIRKIYIFHETVSADGKSTEIKTIEVNLPKVDSAITKAP